MIKIHIPGLQTKSSEYRRGDCQIIHDSDGHCIVIDGGRAELTDKMMSYLRANGLTHVTFICTHWHADHDAGLSALVASKDIYVDALYCPPALELKKISPSDSSRGAGIISRVQVGGSPVIYPVNGNELTVGEIRIVFWRHKASTTEQASYRVNNTSLQTYFPDLNYLSTGDIISEFTNYLKYAKDKGWKITTFKIPHHGNACGKEKCTAIKALGAKWCWYNDIEPGGKIGSTGFSKFGALRTKEAGITTVQSNADIDMIADGGMLKITKGSSSWSFSIPYGKEQSVVSITANVGFRGFNISKRTVKPQYIVIHYTGAEGTAAENVQYFNGADRNASADIFVGHNGELMAYNNDIAGQYTWHCGGPLESSHHPFYNICTNANSVGVELCTKKAGDAWIFYDATVDAAVEVTKYLMNKFGIPVEKVIRHYDVTGKACPRVSGWGAVGGDSAWNAFKERLVDESEKPYRVRKTWADAESQKGAFNDLNNAIALAKETGLKVYDKAGKQVYPEVIISTGITVAARMRQLKKNMTGNDVKLVQLVVGAPVTGTYDDATVEAVKVWQKEHKLTADGWIGAKSMPIILQEAAK